MRIVLDTSAYSHFRCNHDGELFVALRRAGTPIPVNDIWIAAATIDAGAHLLTFDSDFDRIAQLDRTIFR